MILIINSNERRLAMFPLGLLGAGEQAEIMSINCGPEQAYDCRSGDLGLRVGKTVQMLSNGGGGPVLLKLDESRLAIARRMAMKILVRRPR